MSAYDGTLDLDNFYWVLILAVYCSLLCGYAAEQKGRNYRKWLAAGFLFGPLAIPFALVAKRRAD
jgi:hypothetical protein